MNALVEKLLALPELDSEEVKQVDYGTLFASEEEVAVLLELFENDDLLGECDDEQWYMVRAHAWRALGERGEMRFFESFVDMLRHAIVTGDEFYCEDFAVLMKKIGAEAVPPLLAFVFDEDLDDKFRGNVVMALDDIAREEDLRESVTDEYARYLGMKRPSREINAFLVATLAELKVAEHASAIRGVFEANCVNVHITGDLEAVEIDLGVRDSRSTDPPENLPEYEQELSHRARREEMGPPPESDDNLEILNYFLHLHGTPNSMRTVSQLDGFLLACVCSPQPVMPSKWMARIWDPEGNPDAGPIWDSEDELQRFNGALMELLNNNVESLRGDGFTPVAIMMDTEDGPKESFLQWALGAYAGIEFWETRKQAVKKLKEDLVTQLVEVIRLESEEFKEDVSLPPLRAAMGLLEKAYFEHREDLDLLGGAGAAWGPAATYQREAPKVGRNDPCPCGSGKKFKKCCGS